MSLIYYIEEKQKFPEAYGKKLDCFKATKIVIRKLCRHYKLGSPAIDWTSGCRKSKMMHSWAGTRIIINLDCNNFGIVCHEVAHLYQLRRKKHTSKWHTKKHTSIMRRMIAYCKKKGWFEAELKRRTAPKPIKPEPTKEELRLKKIARLEKAIKRHQTKIKRSQTAIKKAHRRIAGLKRFV